MAETTEKIAGLAVVIPCHNAGPRLAPVVAGALARAEKVIVVDDGCTDGSTDGAAEAGAEMLVFPVNRGKGHALLAGIARALEHLETRVVCTMDADGQHDPAELPGLLAAFDAARADLLIGRRTFDTGSVPWRSRFGNRATALVTRLLLGRDLPDTQCGYRLMSRGFAEALAGNLSGGRYETEMEMIVYAVRAGHTLASAPVRTLYEPGNRSSHFRKVRDSWLIYARLLRAVRRFPRS
ncbi:MAG: glycosyltransferase family 2 protein [Candidatus Hydrogenedens sp.]|nr:glycosyltransferase family 2 protein [Candidatus Hydrogenedentota bacterium]NLF58692.1 glycosyltransferase family 2 protein [Candidatus Hydrogenedens sp.]